VHKLEFRKTILGVSGELHDRYIANTYMPLTHAEKRIGVIETYADVTPIIQRIFPKPGEPEPIKASRVGRQTVHPC